MIATLFDQQSQRYPMIRNGGIFVLCIGMGILLGTLLGGDEPVQQIVFFLGTGIGITALFTFGKQLSFGISTHKQQSALSASIVLEIVLMIALGYLYRGNGFRDYWLWILLIVGFHFLPLGFAFGPWMVLLGTLCIANALIGFWLSTMPFLIFGSMDGLLKIAVGFVMFMTRSKATEQQE